MDDGGYTGSGLKLHTNAFSMENLYILISVLDSKFYLTFGPFFFVVCYYSSPLGDAGYSF